MRLRAGILALLLASGCSLAQSLQMKNATPRERETVYAVIGTFVVMSVVAGLIAGAPPEQPSMMPRPSTEPPLGP
ncbi:MAG TPA: hypothetical protein VNO30_03720 [Kofleriaceae bacterium]|nr:hypothetical protein [Kofleriaceae bacterium]